MEREPVVLANMVAATVSALIVALVSLDVLPWTGEQQAAVVAAVVALVNLGAALWARRQVTPLADPRDDEGEALVREWDGMTPVRR